MSDHISTRQMERFYARSLEVPELALIASHLATCADCRQVFHEVSRRSRELAHLSFNLSPEAWLKHEHLTYEQLAPYVEERLDKAEREIVDIHLGSCERCREDLSSFLDHRQRIEPEMNVRYAPHEASTWREKLFPRWDKSVSGWKPIYAAAIVVIVAGAVILTAMLLGRFRTSDSQAQRTAPTHTNSASPTPSINASDPSLSAVHLDEAAHNSVSETLKSLNKNSNSARLATPQSRTILKNGTISRPMRSVQALIWLNDGGGRVTFNKSGDLTGLGNISDQTQQSIKEVLQAQNIKRPEALAEVTGGDGTLRGATRKPSPLSLISPERTILTQDRPTFRWEPHEGATSYRVHVVDSNNHEVAKSSELPSTMTQWTPPVTLRRGIVYTWVVTAMVRGEEIMSPAASEPEMRFKVLEAEKLSELNRLKETSSSHLALGIWYARAGIFQEAEREFQLLVNNNPHSPLALKLLRDVQSWR